MTALPRWPFQIREMTEADLPAVFELERLAFTNPWSPDLLRRELGHEWSTTLLVEEPDEAGRMRLLGVLIFWVVHDELHVLNVATDPSARRRGVAAAALEACLERARQARCSLATLEVRRGNQPAIKLYERFGFRIVGVRPNYYSEERADALVMVLDLSPTVR